MLRNIAFLIVLYATKGMFFSSVCRPVFGHFMDRFTPQLVTVLHGYECLRFLERLEGLGRFSFSWGPSSVGSSRRWPDDGVDGPRPPDFHRKHPAHSNRPWGDGLAVAGAAGFGAVGA